MTEALFISAMVVGICCLAVVLLAWRDTWRQRRRDEQRPLSERIEDIRKDAAFMTRHFQHFLEREPPLDTKTIAWARPVLEYYRRLEGLASASEPSTEEALRLAEEASCFIHERRLKGICVVEQARKLAALTSRRDAA